MSFNEDAVLAKFSTLTETQESIVSISQWVMFHRRYASVTAEIWDKALRKAPQNKRLALIYLANEVVQQSRAKKRDEFVKAFARHAPGALAFAYRQAPNPDTKARIRRVADVWRQRNIFPPDVLDRVDEALSEPRQRFGGTGVLGRSSNNNGTANGSGSAELPPFLSKLLTMHKSLSTCIAAAEGAARPAAADYAALVDDADTLPAPREYARRLRALAPELAAAHAAAARRRAARAALADHLRSLAASSDALLREDDTALRTLERQQARVSELVGELREMLGPEAEQEDAAEEAAARRRRERSGTPPFEPPAELLAAMAAAPPAKKPAAHDMPTFLYDNDSSDEEDGDAAGSTTPPAPAADPADTTFGGFSIVSGDSDNEGVPAAKAPAASVPAPAPAPKKPAVAFDTAAPTYASSSDSDDSDTERPSKRAKVAEADATAAAAAPAPAADTNAGGAAAAGADFGALDPRIAQFLSSIAKGTSLLGPPGAPQG